MLVFYSVSIGSKVQLGEVYIHLKDEEGFPGAITVIYVTSLSHYSDRLSLGVL